MTNFKEENYLTENEEKKHFQGCVAFNYASTLSEVKEEIFQAEEDTQIKGPVVTYTSGEGPSIDDMDIAKMKTMFSLEKIAASAGPSSSSSEVITDSSNDDEDILESEKDEEVLTKIKCRVDEEMINRVKAIVVQNTKDNSKSFLKHDAITSCQSGERSVNVVQRMFKSEVNKNIELEKEQRMTRTPGLEPSRMVTVRARLASATPSSPVVKAFPSKNESIKQTSKKRLITKIDG